MREYNEKLGINSVEIAKVDKIINGFNVKEGYIIFASNSDIVAISSGWTDWNDMLYIFTYQNGEWVGDWEDDYLFPVEEALEKLNEHQKEKELDEVKIEVANLLKEGVDLYKSDNPITFVDVVAGNLCNDGGEYGFYSTYYPTEVTGIYELHTSTTCEFDSCGTGYEGLEILTQEKYEYLLSEEEKVLEAKN